MAKFSKCDQRCDVAVWGAPYDGSCDVQLSRAEELSRSKILDGSLPRARAQMVIDALDDAHPWYTRIDFIDAIAALVALHWEEVVKKVTGHHTSLLSTLTRFLSLLVFVNIFVSPTPD